MAIQAFVEFKEVQVSDFDVFWGVGAYMQKAGDTCDISPQFFWIFRKILG